MKTFFMSIVEIIDVIYKTRLPGIADTSLLLHRGSNSREAVLSTISRDVEERDYDLHIDTDSMSWNVLVEKTNYKLAM